MGVLARQGRAAGARAGCLRTKSGAWHARDGAAAKGGGGPPDKPPWLRQTTRVIWGFKIETH
jgi:hypothetical protein